MQSATLPAVALYDPHTNTYFLEACDRLIEADVWDKAWSFMNTISWGPTPHQMQDPDHCAHGYDLCWLPQPPKEWMLPVYTPYENLTSKMELGYIKKDNKKLKGSFY